MIAAIPSPEQGVWYLGPIPVRAYSLCLLAGIILAGWWTRRRLVARGYSGDAALDVAMWAVPFGILGGRLYHVLSSPQAYFGQGGEPLKAFRSWEGGLGIWGAVALGAVGAWIGCRRSGIPLLVFGDALAPTLAVAQAVGRWGNWFNNEIYGAATTVPWALTIHDWDFAAGRAVLDAQGRAVVLGTFHPTFLYESLWCLLVAAALLLVERRYRLARGQLMALYVMLYTLGRLVIESIRVDEANHVLGLRLNVWTSIGVFLFGLWWWARLASGPPAAAPLETPGPARVETSDGADAPDARVVPWATSAADEHFSDSDPEQTR